MPSRAEAGQACSLETAMLARDFLASKHGTQQLPQEAHVAVSARKTGLSRKFARILFWLSLTVFILIATLYGLSFCFCVEYIWWAEGLVTTPAPRIASQPATYFLIWSIDQGVLGRGCGYAIAESGDTITHQILGFHIRRSNLKSGSYPLRYYLLPCAVPISGLPLTNYSIPLWMLAVPFAVLSFSLRRWRHRPEQGHCESCGYNLRGNTSGVCPECGTPIPEDLKQRLADNKPEPSTDSFKE